jgi:hypothetical protein
MTSNQYDKLTVAELREISKDKGLPIGPKVLKAMLINNLKVWDKQVEQSNYVDPSLYTSNRIEETVQAAQSEVARKLQSNVVYNLDGIKFTVRPCKKGYTVKLVGPTKLFFFSNYSNWNKSIELTATRLAKLEDLGLIKPKPQPKEVIL